MKEMSAHGFNKRDARVHGFKKKRVINCSRARTIRGNYLALADCICSRSSGL